MSRLETVRRRAAARACDTAAAVDLAEVHHIQEWADGGLTNMDELTFGCGPDYKKIKPGGWRTRKRKDGRTEWLPPPHLPIPGGTNTYRHPERMLPVDDE